MDQGACLGFEDDGEDVDLTAPAMSAAAYMKQMRAERNMVADVAVMKKDSKGIEDLQSPEAKKKKLLWLERNGVVLEEKKEKTPSSLVPSEDWQHAKSKEFGEFRKQIAQKIATTKPMKLKILKMPEEEEWHKILLEKCLPEFSEIINRFPNHTGTPPAMQMVLAIPKRHLSQLLENLVDWSSEEGLTRPIREWIYALLLVIDTPLVQDVVSALRTLAKQCKSLRSQLTPDRSSEAYEFSLFIAIIGIYFVQKDVSDL